MAIHPLVLLQVILILWPIKASEDSCLRTCGNVSIWYPFGIGEGCYYTKGFEVTCHKSSNKAFLSSINLELYGDGEDISEAWLTALVNVPHDEGASASHNLSGSPFSLSGTDNLIAGIGCEKYANISQKNSTTGACHSFCTCDPTQHQGCCDFLCPLLPNQTLDDANIEDISSDERIPQECRPSFMVDQYWLGSKYLPNPSVLKYKKPIPVSLKWGEPKGRCVELFNQDRTSCNKDNFCLIQMNSHYVCLCDDRTSDGDQGCSGELICNTTGGYNCSECPPGYNYSPQRDQKSQCSSSRSFNEILKKKKRRFNFFIIIGCSSGLGTLLLLLGAWRLYKFIKKRKAIRLKQKFFERNGGLLLQQHLSSHEGNIEKIKVFTSRELEKATDNYNVNRVLGRGGQGTVYKGMLAEGRIVAIKKSTVVNESKLEEFINEVVILSRINHKNVVQLLGCCLETEVPLLVYEFISNGNLFHHIHNQNEEFPFTWERRVSIAKEVACALSYLHSSTSIPIYHRDIKSTNILLDVKYRAKVSDFGISRSISVDQTHLTTQVRGTFGYIDPEYFLSSQFTEKSDVYSFGVVLAELLTGQNPIRSTNCEENKSLITYFLQAIEENRLFEILDPRVLKEGKQSEIMTIANLTRRCLNSNGKKRPTMREVVVELYGIRASKRAVVMQQLCEGNDFGEDYMSSTQFETAGSSLMRSVYDETGSSFTRSFSERVNFSTDVTSLISNN